MWGAFPNNCDDSCCFSGSGSCLKLLRFRHYYIVRYYIMTKRTETLRDGLAFWDLYLVILVNKCETDYVAHGASLERNQGSEVEGSCSTPAQDDASD